MNLRASFPEQSDVNGADRCAVLSAVRTGVAGDANAEIGFIDARNALCHFRRCLLRHSRIRLQRLRTHAENFLLDFIAVGAGAAFIEF